MYEPLYSLGCRYCLEHLKTSIFWDTFAISNQTAQIHINGVARHRARFDYCLAPRMTARQRRDRGVVPALVRLKNNAICVAHTLHYNTK